MIVVETLVLLAHCVICEKKLGTCCMKWRKMKQELKHQDNIFLREKAMCIVCVFKISWGTPKASKYWKRLSNIQLKCHQLWNVVEDVFDGLQHTCTSSLVVYYKQSEWHVVGAGNGGGQTFCKWHQTYKMTELVVLLFMYSSSVLGFPDTQKRKKIIHDDTNTKAL